MMLIGAVAGLAVVFAFVLGAIYGKGITIKNSSLLDERPPEYNNTENLMPKDVKHYYDLQERYAQEEGE